MEIIGASARDLGKAGVFRDADEREFPLHHDVPERDVIEVRGNVNQYLVLLHFEDFGEDVFDEIVELGVTFSKTCLTLTETLLMAAQWVGTVRRILTWPWKLAAFFLKVESM